MCAGLDREEKLMDIGSRNFFLCPRKCGGNGDEGSGTTPFGSCSREISIGEGSLLFVNSV